MTDALRETSALSPVRAERPVNTRLVSMLEAALNDARAGKMTAGGVVAVLGPSNFLAFSDYGTTPGEVIAACELLKVDVLTKMRAPRSDRIIRPPLRR